MYSRLHIATGLSGKNIAMKFCHLTRSQGYHGVYPDELHPKLEGVVHLREKVNQKHISWARREHHHSEHQGLVEERAAVVVAAPHFHGITAETHVMLRERKHNKILR